MSGVAFVTAALIVVLSVFNGLENLLRSLNTSFDPEIKIQASKGKFFSGSQALLTDIKSIPGVNLVTEVMEDYAYVRYRQAEMVVTIKGVSNNFLDQHRLDSHIISGKLKLLKDSSFLAIIGQGIRHTLSVEIEDDLSPLQVYYVKNVSSAQLNPSKIYIKKDIRPGAVFAIEKNYDENYIFVPIEFTKALLQNPDKLTSIEVMTNGSNLTEIQDQLKQKLGSQFSVLNNDEQHKDIYKLVKMERLFIFFSLSLLLLVGSINIFFSLMMLAIDKRKDISILVALGATPKIIRNIFLFEGAIISYLGAIAGLLIGASLCLIQMKFGIVGMGVQNSIVSSYPVTLRATDFFLTAMVIILISSVISFRPASLATKYYSINLL